METQISPNYFRIALQSALAAAFCLGLPAGLLLWLILIRQAYPSPVVAQAVTLLQASGLNKIIVLALCSLIWSFLLSRISGYRPWWKLGLATSIAIIAGWFSPLSNLDAVFPEGTPVHVVYAVAMCGIVASATLCVGLAYGLILRSGNAARMLALTTTLASVSALLMTILLFDRFGIRVGGATPLAMSRVTVTSLLISSIAGGMTLGIGFSWLVKKHTTK
jgi:hypothetical protein